MPSHTKVKLSDVRTLTFYAGDKTKARRTTAIEQLKCIGKPCRTYQPDVVRCTNTGGSGIDVDWKCEADLPATLRLGRVEVSCEGWARAGDPYVLKGSCGLEYHLQEIPKAYRDDHTGATHSSGFADHFDTFINWAFYSLFIAIFLFIAYQMIKSCLTRPYVEGNAGHPRGGPGGGGGGWFNNGGGTQPDPGTNAPPPPYTKDTPGTSTPGATGWRPGFWTGLGAGGLLGRYFRPSPYVPYQAPQRSMWDWDRSWFAPGPTRAYQAAPPQGSERASFGNWFNSDRSARRDDDRGEGSSSGTMRRSTGYGGSRVR